MYNEGMTTNQEPSNLGVVRTSGTDFTDTHYSLASFTNGVLILTLLYKSKGKGKSRAVTVVLSGEQASEFVRVANYSQEGK